MKTMLALLLASACLAAAQTNTAPGTNVISAQAVIEARHQGLVHIARQRAALLSKIAALEQASEDACARDLRRERAGEITATQRIHSLRARTSEIKALKDEAAVLDLKELRYRENHKLPIPDRLK